MRYYLKARSGIWYICWTDAAGRPQRASARTRDRGEAELALARWTLKHAQPRDLLPTDTTLEAVLVRYWQHHGQTRFSPHAIRRTIAAVAEHLPCCALADLTIPRQEGFVSALSVSPSTAHRYMGVIAAALSWAHRRQEIAAVPGLLRIEHHDGDGARPFTVDELRALMAAARHEHERRFLLLSIATGARPHAVLELTWDRVSEVADFNVPGRRRTKKRRAKAPLAPTVGRWLAERRGLGPVIQWQGKPLHGHRMTFRRIAERAGIEGSAYGLRKALATWLREQNVPEWEVGALLGHRVASATTERYAHHRPDFMAATRAAVERLIREISPVWLASALPVEAERVAQVLDGTGRREWDRTTDHFHVKGGRGEGLQPLRAANDD